MCTIKILVSQKNYLYLPRIVNYWKKIRSDGIGIRLVQDYNYGEEGPRSESVELTNTQKNDLVRLISSNNNLNPLFDNFSKTLSMQKIRPETTHHCYSATDGHFACIDHLGDVYLGNPEIGNKKYTIGNICDQNWNDVWNSQRHLDVIKIMDNEEQNASCDNFLCRHVRANHGIEKYLQNATQPPPDTELDLKNLDAFL